MRMMIEHNKCVGTFVPIVVLDNGTQKRGAKWQSYREAYDALIFYQKNGIFPSEVEQHDVTNICQTCGKELAA